MILRSIELESFGRFRGETFEFRRGLNLVIGPNEAGKSTIAEAVPAVLFGTDRLERFKPWGRNVCSASLFFEGRGHTIEVKRNLLTDEVELVEKDDLYHVRSQFSGNAPLRGRSASCREYRALLEKLIGVADARLFRATYFFGHHPQSWSGDELAIKLRTLVSGTAEADYAEILDSLLDEHFQLTRSNPWGRDKQRDREYETVCQQLLEQGDEGAVPIFVEIDNTSSDERQVALEEEISGLKDELEFERQEYEKGQRYIERFRQKASINTEKYEQPVKVEPASEEKTGLKKTLAEKLKAAGLPPSLPPQLPEVLSEAAEIRQGLASLQQPFSILHGREKKIPQVPWMVIGCLFALFAALSAVAFWQPFFKTPLLTAVGVSSLVLLAWVSWRQIIRNKLLEQCRKERNLLEQKKGVAQQRQAELSERCDVLGLPSSAVDLVRLQKLVMTHRAVLDQYWSATESDDPGVVTGAEVAERELSAQDATESVVEKDLLIDDEVAEELRQLEAKLADFAASLQEKDTRLLELQAQLKSNMHSPGTAAEAATGQGPLMQDISVKSALSPLQRRKNVLEGRIAVLRKSINLLAEAVDEFSRSNLVTLNTEAGKMLGKITGGRYKEIKLDENMMPSIQVDGRRWTPVDQFSRGTVDAIYLALRMALAKVRDDGRSLPLMLDDPFVHLDQKRLAKTLNLVDLASADGQLILFSHNQELGKRAARERWHVVPLDVDAVDITPSEGGENAGQLHLL
jgi:energy-coupling factor transporter ATP-binding protein EcfA2